DQVHGQDASPVISRDEDLPVRSEGERGESSGQRGELPSRGRVPDVDGRCERMLRWIETRYKQSSIRAEGDVIARTILLDEPQRLVDLPEPRTQVPANQLPESLRAVRGRLEGLEHPEQAPVGLALLG